MLGSCSQPNLFYLCPPLQVLLASNCHTHPLELLKIDRPIKFVAASEAPFESSGLVLIETLATAARRFEAKTA
jgi:hypothetical protein